ncbi:MAG: hypothetical protein ACE5JV_03690 [Nitrososphaerales archaeon]
MRFLLYFTPLLLLLLSGMSVAGADHGIKAQTAVVVEPDAQVIVESASYSPGSIVYVGIFDRDFNLSKDVLDSIDLTIIVQGDPIVEVRIVQPTQGTITLSAVDGSLQDRNGRMVTNAMESGPDTSLFEFEIKLSEDIEANSSVTVLYTDPFELTPTTRERIPVQQKIALIDTRLAESTGKPLKEASIGQKVVASSIIQSRVSSDLKYAYIVQVKDSDGFTVALSWISGILKPQRSADARVAWTPDSSGRYTVEIFVWQDLLKPVPLLLKHKASTITVS